MANSFNHDPMIMDTASDKDDSTTFYSGPVSVSAFVWDAIGSADDDIILKDSYKGNVILVLRSHSKELVHVTFAEPITFSGLFLDTVDSGKLYIYS